jgi:hypothetical protein
MANITVAQFRDVAGGLQPGQFGIGDRVKISGLGNLDPIYKALLDRPITVTLGLIGPDGSVGLTPMWFDYEGDQVLVNTASHRRKCDWIRKSPRFTILIVNPDNAYHWVQLKCSVGPRGTGMGAGRRTGDAPARQDLDEIHRQPAALTACAIPPSTRSACCSSATSTASQPSASREPPLGALCHPSRRRAMRGSSG